MDIKNGPEKEQRFAPGEILVKASGARETSFQWANKDRSSSLCGCDEAPVKTLDQLNEENATTIEKSSKNEAK